MAVNLLHVPAGGFETFFVIFGRRKRGRAVNRNAVIVKQDDQFRQFHVTGHRNGFLGNAFHQAAVTGNHIGEVIDNIIAKARIHDAFAKRETNRGRNALTQRAGGGFDTGTMAEFRVTGSTRTHLTEILDLIQIEIFVTRKVQKRIKQH